MNPQLYEPLMDRLFEAGALDVFLTPVIMKRSRPGTVLTALCPKDKVPDLSRVLFEESSTIGVRWTEVSRTRLDREMVTIVTDYGPLPFKVSRLAGRVVTVTPEFADVVRLAQAKSLPVREVLSQAHAAARRHLTTSDPAPGGGGPSGAPHVGRLTVRPSSLRLSPRKHLSAQN